MCEYNDCIHKAKEGYINTMCLACKHAYFENTEAYEYKPDLYRTERCRHMNDNGSCLKGASSCGYCKRHCSYFERLKAEF